MLKNFVFTNLSKSVVPQINLNAFFHIRNTESWKKKYEDTGGSKIKFGEYNNKVFPPQKPDEPPRPAYVCHYKENIKYSYKKLWYVACLVRGMTVDEALKQLLFVHKKGAAAVRETILEAQKMAVEDHNVEFKTNLWVSESFVGKGFTAKGLRRHAKGRISAIKYKYTHYFVTLEEGEPPKDYYYYKREKSGDELLQEWLQKMRERKILQSL